MSAPPVIKTFEPEDYPDAPDWALKLMENLNANMTALRDPLSRRLTRGENMLAGSRLDMPFTSAASGVTTVRVKTDLPFAPKHVSISGLRKRSGVIITAVWSATSKPAASGSFDVTFQGLDASTDYFFNALFE